MTTKASTTFTPTDGSSSSIGPARSVRSEDVRTLADQIVRSFGDASRGDLTTRWMANHIASLMRDAEAATADAGSADRCRDAIMQLWQHRAHWPRGHRPFEAFENIFEVLDRLGPDASRPRYVQPWGNKNDGPWLDAARTADDAARSLVLDCVRLAAEKAAGEAAEWINSVEGFASGADWDVILMLIGTQDGPDEPSEDGSNAYDDLIQIVDAVRKAKQNTTATDDAD